MKNAKKLFLFLILAAGQSVFAPDFLLPEGGIEAGTGVDPVSGTGGDHGGVDLNPTDGTGKDPVETPIAERGDGKTDPTVQDGTGILDGKTPADQSDLLHHDESGYGGSDTGTGVIQSPRGLIEPVGDGRVGAVIGDGTNPSGTATVSISDSQPGELGDSAAQLDITIAKTTTPGNAQEAITAIEGDTSLTIAEKRDKVGEVMANVLIEAFGTAETDPATFLKMEQDLTALEQTTILSDYERSAMQQTLTELKTDVGAKLDEQVELKTLSSVQDAYSNDMITKTDLIEVLNEIAQNSQSTAVTDKINDIQETALGLTPSENAVVNDVVTTVHTAQVTTKSAADKSAQDFESVETKSLKAIDKTLSSYSAKKDALLKKQFETLAQLYVKADADIKDAVESVGLSTQLFTMDSAATRFVVKKNGTVDITATRTRIDQLLNPDNLSTAEKEFLGSSVIGGIDAKEYGFNADRKRVVVADMIATVKQRINDPQLEAWLDSISVQSDGTIISSQGPITPAQKIALADAWLKPVQGKTVPEMSRADIEKLAKVKETVLTDDSSEGSANKVALRDLGQEFSNDILFKKFLDEYYRDKPLTLSENEKEAFMKDMMAAADTGQGGEKSAGDLRSETSSSLLKLQEKYNSWKQKQLSTTLDSVEKSLSTLEQGSSKKITIDSVQQQLDAVQSILDGFDTQKMEGSTEETKTQLDKDILALKVKYEGYLKRLDVLKQQEKIKEYPAIQKELADALNGIDGKSGLLKDVGQQSSAESFVQTYFDRAKAQIAQYDAVGISNPAIEALKTRYNTLLAEFKVKRGGK